jgi:hypothetical protein
LQIEHSQVVTADALAVPSRHLARDSNWSPTFGDHDLTVATAEAV